MRLPVVNIGVRYSGSRNARAVPPIYLLFYKLRAKDRARPSALQTKTKPTNLPPVLTRLSTILLSVITLKQIAGGLIETGRTGEHRWFISNVNGLISF